MVRVALVGLLIAGCGASRAHPSSSRAEGETVAPAAEAPDDGSEAPACTASAEHPLDDAVCAVCAVDEEPTVHPAIDWLELEIMDPGPLRTGEVHRIEVRVTNVGASPQRVVFGRHLLTLALLAPGGSGAAVDDRAPERCGSSVQVVLEPSGTIVLHRTLSLLHGGYDCAELSKNCFPSSEPVLPGDYQLYVGLDLRRVATPAGPGDYANTRRAVTVIRPPSE